MTAVPDHRAEEPFDLTNGTTMRIYIGLDSAVPGTT
jgi:hypothetical protein